MTRLAWLALSLSFSFSLGASENITERRQQDLRNLLIQDCGSCHGLTLKGGLGPALSPPIGQSVEYLSAVILNGRPGTAMPPWRALLSADEARWMAEQLLQEKLP